MKLNKIGIILSYSLILLVGFLAGKLIFIPGISVQKEINPLHFISIVSTLFMAIVISVLIDKERRINDVEKKLIIDKLQAIWNETEELEKLVNSKQVLHCEVISLIKRIRSATSFVEKALKTIGKSPCSSIQQLKTYCKQLSDLATNTVATDPQKPIPEEVKIDNGYVFYSQNRVAEIEACIGTLGNELFQSQINTNRL